MQKITGEINVCEAILARRSVREYKAKKVDAKRIRILIEAAVRAPTAMSIEPWAFVIIQDIDFLKHISDIAKNKPVKELESKEMQTINPADSSIFYDAATLIVICGLSDNPYAVADCWMAAENLMLAAHAMDLGTCVIGDAIKALNDKYIKEILGVSQNFEAIAPIIIGYPTVKKDTSKRKKPLIFSWLEA